MAKVEIYTTPYCPYCIRAKALLTRKGVAFVDTDVTADSEKRAWLREVTGRHTVPQIFINGQPLGGYDDISALDKEGKLDPLLAQPSV